MQFIYCMYIFVYLYIHGCTLRLEKRAGDSESGFIHGCEPSLWAWELSWVRSSVSAVNPLNH